MNTLNQFKIKIENNKIFVPIKNKWLKLTPEEKVRQEYICRLINYYGYSLDQMAQELTVTGSKRARGRAQADIVIWKNKEARLKDMNAFIVIECKAENITIHQEDYYQGYNYASWAGADFFVTTNIKETKVFKVVKEKLPKSLDEIIDIPNAADINNEKVIKDLLTQTKAFTRDEFSKLLFKCHNIIRNNDKLSPEAAFDEISKILFVKIRYERKNDGIQLFSKKQFLKDKESWDRHKSYDSRPFYQQLFENTKNDFIKDNLFSETETIRIRENSFEAIVKELEKYNLSTTSDDVKGIAFEQFLGKTFRGELGQFFTPRTIVDFMVDILDPEEGETICDPCCGSGGFLIKTFEYVRTKIEDKIQTEKQNIKKKYFNVQYDNMTEKQQKKIDMLVNNFMNKLNYELDINNKDSRLRKLSYNCIFGTDANPRMSRTAKMNMIMHGDGHGGVHHNEGLLNVNGIFENRFDIIITNPPFGSRVDKSLKITDEDIFRNKKLIREYTEKYGEEYENALKQISDNIEKPIIDLYKTGKMSTLTEVLFLERCINLLKPGGRMGIVLPEGVLNNNNLQKVRDFFESKAKIILITSIPQDVFIALGATFKPSLLFFKKFTLEESEKWQQIKQNAEKQVSEKYKTSIEEVTNILSLKGKEALSKAEKKSERQKLKSLEQQMETEVKQKLKIDFDYEIPIAKIDKAGITTTGAQCENELIPLAEEFRKYRIKNNLWNNIFEDIQYETTDDNRLYRVALADRIEIIE